MYTDSMTSVKLEAGAHLVALYLIIVIQLLPTVLVLDLLPDIEIMPFSNLESSPPQSCLVASSTHSSIWRNNGADALALERYQLRELAEGWPCYRDAGEWDNFRSLFVPPTVDDSSGKLKPNAFVYTTWSGRVDIDSFIEMSRQGMEKGVFIMHRVCGSTTDIQETLRDDPDNLGSLKPRRAVTKMKAVITQRFVLDGCEVDVEADCRFCFFWEKISVSSLPTTSPPTPNTTGPSSDSGNTTRLEWRARFVRHFYEKDKLIPTNPNRVPQLDEMKLEQYPLGYRYLAYCQEQTMGGGVKVKQDLPGHLREGDTLNKKEHDKLLVLCKRWLEGDDVEV